MLTEGQPSPGSLCDRQSARDLINGPPLANRVRLYTECHLVCCGESNILRRVACGLDATFQTRPSLNYAKFAEFQKPHRAYMAYERSSACRLSLLQFAVRKETRGTMAAYSRPRSVTESLPLDTRFCLQWLRPGDAQAKYILRILRVTRLA